MRHNMGKVERVARIAAGVLFILFGLIVMNGFGVLYGVVTNITLYGLALTLFGLVSFVTGLTGNCVLYNVFKFNTCKLCREGTEHG